MLALMREWCSLLMYRLLARDGASGCMHSRRRSAARAAQPARVRRCGTAGLRRFVGFLVLIGS